MSNKNPVGESDFATIALIIAICDSLIEANQIDVEGLLTSLANAEAAFEQRQYLIAAGVVGKVRSALIDPEHSKNRHLSLAPTPTSDDEQ